MSGLPIWPFMLLARHFSMSSRKTLAVMAAIRTCAAHGTSNARMMRVAPPSSIFYASNLPEAVEVFSLGDRGKRRQNEELEPLRHGQEKSDSFMLRQLSITVMAQGKVLRLKTAPRYDAASDRMEILSRQLFVSLWRADDSGHIVARQYFAECADAVPDMFSPHSRQSRARSDSCGLLNRHG